ncbi:ATPase [Candidatus Weimeria sp. HCP3S3_B5]|uniref:ATPase n=1 Tax=Candidatus Weimeria sp. HCP3S3_B5 TaxID=3438871 RepID=UPI002A96D4D0|nr:ATPase [Lachnospiraceae bacterium]MDY6352347.1 ATPase [Lachnospiraceae bacterium]
MASEIEDIIDSIEDFIEECKPAVFSSGKITVDRDQMESLLEELRSRTPVEIKQYQRVLKNKDAIIEQARKQADAIIAEAKAKSNQMMSENEIMQQAYAKANEVVGIAKKDADEILTKATEDANSIRLSSLRYSDQLMSDIGNVLQSAIDTTQTGMGNYLNTMKKYLETINVNRSQISVSLKPEDIQQGPAIKDQAADNGSEEKKVQ